MIRLFRPPVPIELDAAKVAALTAEFASTGASVWKQKYIEDALQVMSYGKCCFCECKVDEESKYAEIEHFHPKKRYPGEVVLWDNLFYICKRCNTTKLNHDTKLEPIINPAKDTPKTHLYLAAYRFYEKTDLGRKTIDVVDLNNRPRRIVEKRFELGTKICESLEEIWAEKIPAYLDDPTPNKMTRILNKFELILQNATPDKEYSGSQATSIIEYAHYQEIKDFIINNNKWNERLQALHTIICNNALLP